MSWEPVALTHLSPRASLSRGSIAHSHTTSAICDGTKTTPACINRRRHEEHVTGICTASIIRHLKQVHFAHIGGSRVVWQDRHIERHVVGITERRISFYDCLSIFYDDVHTDRAHAHKNYITLTWCDWYFFILCYADVACIQICRRL